MYIWTEETRKLMDEVRDYLDDNSEMIPDAPQEIKEKWQKMRSLLAEEKERQIELMLK